MKYVLAILLLASTASAATISVPSLEARNTDSDTAIPIYVSTDRGDRAVGANLYAQASGLSALGLNLIDGTIFENNHGEDWECFDGDIAANSILTDEGDVLADGLLATLRVNTLGAVRGVHPIRLHGIQAYGMTFDSDLVNIQPAFEEGYLTVFGPPFVTWDGQWHGDPCVGSTVFVTANLSIERLNVDALIIRSAATVPEPNGWVAMIGAWLCGMKIMITKNAAKPW